MPPDSRRHSSNCANSKIRAAPSGLISKYNWQGFRTQQRADSEIAARSLWRAKRATCDCYCPGPFVFAASAISFASKGR
jgi:hypothetical protein